MAFVTLNEAKNHLNIPLAISGEDAYINSLIQVAEVTVESHLNRPLTGFTGGTGEVVLPAPLKQAMLLYIGNLYQNRELVGPKDKALPFNYDYLINLYRNYD